MQTIDDVQSLSWIMMPFPRRGRGRPATGDAIATRMLPALTVRPQIPIREAILGKSPRYGDLDSHILIAVNALSMYASEEDAVDAVSGYPVVAIVQTPTGLAPSQIYLSFQRVAGEFCE